VLAYRGGVVTAPETFFKVQSRARRNSAILLVGSFIILWLAASVVTFFAHTATGDCRPSATGTEVCETVVRINYPWLIGVAVVVALYLAVAMALSGRAALALAGAQPADGPDYQQLRNVVEEMSVASGMPVPRVYVVNDPSPNAFATGLRPHQAAVTVTTGLMNQLSRRELKGVVAHELGHIANRDIAVTTIAVLTVGTIAAIADVAMRIAWYTMMFGGRQRRSNEAGVFAVGLFAIALVLYVFALPAALLLRAAISRQREVLADASAVQYTRDPYGIRSALEKLEADGTSPQKVSVATAHMWIDEPKPAANNQRRILSGLYDSHPPIASRISLLRRMEGIDPDERGPNDMLPFRVIEHPPAGRPAPAWAPPSDPPVSGPPTNPGNDPSI